MQTKTPNPYRIVHYERRNDTKYVSNSRSQETKKHDSASLPHDYTVESKQPNLNLAAIIRFRKITSAAREKRCCR